MRKKNRGRLTIDRETLNRLMQADLPEVIGGTSGEYGPGCASWPPNCNITATCKP